MPLGCGRQPFLAPCLPEPGRAQLFFQREAKCCLRQGFLALKCRTHLLLFKADQWEVDLTLMAQRCCWSVLSRGFLGLKELEGRGGDAKRNILNILSIPLAGRSQKQVVTVFPWTSGLLL